MQYKELNNGIKMPQLGLGVFQIPQNETKETVINAIKAGYRAIDTARAYGNEKETGEGINEAISNGLVKREDLFLTTKVIFNEYGYEATKNAIEDSLNQLNQDYIDLYLIHQPYGDIYGSYKALVEAKNEGKIKSLGISNFYPAKFVEFMREVKLRNWPKPVINQIEYNPLTQQKVASDFIPKFDVQMEAWAPLAQGRNNIFKNELLSNIGKNHNKSVAQVILRWIMQNDIVTVVKSTNPKRLEENIDIFDFELTNKEMEQINSLDTNKPSMDHQNPEFTDDFYDMIYGL
ncbi:aldo/keto reductase [Lactobacillus sp. S2-2]|uniref:aldo/keto reductase n=1 Tax=Lactobacillus sp. S2-2 TaxID=2692917 RepID=UPI001F29239A|nr:aldo/keto reductase [Lactobacillus sp. S2-2]MCF6515452.1 aldo/keto reductase [Lactobacillus sp. S2-2]